jgi:TolB-like protein/class 3 adenylate cyclase/Tfp pilus assembly protein PilF
LTKVIDTERRLVAIFAADVEGYSRLMGADEVGTMRDLTQRRAILDGLISAHRGRIANTAGDSVLAEFGSAVDAVQCAVEAQSGLAEANASLSPDRQINFRIGVHVGDVMVKGGDLFGDGVNIAARLQTIASAGGTCISGTAHDQVRKILPFAFTDLGAQQVKNIEEPVRAFAVSAKGASPIFASSNASVPLTLPDKPSIAVLPFQNMSGDPEQEYFADGIVEDIITALSRFRSLFVIARNSSFSYKGKSPDIRQVGRELGVRYVLEGSVRKAGGRVRITGQLIEAASGAHLWADKFDGALEDVFDLQDKVTTSVVAAIAPKVELAEIFRASQKPTENLDAHNYYYRGVNSLRAGNRQANTVAQQFFQRAIEIDSNFAAAYGQVAACYRLRGLMGWFEGSREQLTDGKPFALKAIALGRDDAVALSCAAHFLAYVMRDHETAAAIIEQAIDVNPNLVQAQQVRCLISMWMGDHDRAIEQAKGAIRLNPIDPEMHTTEAAMGWANLFLHRFEDALFWATKALARQPSHGPALRVTIIALALLGRIDDAQRTFARLRETDISNPRISDLESRLPFRRQEDRTLYIQGMRLAGMPE